MKALLLSFGVLCSLPVVAQHEPAIKRQTGHGIPVPLALFHSGYIKANGTPVAAYYYTKPDNTNWNNFSTIGNINWYTRKKGTRPKDYTPQAENYGRGRIILTGPRGGQYYISAKGKKIYVPKRWM